MGPLKRRRPANLLKPDEVTIQENHVSKCTWHSRLLHMLSQQAVAGQAAHHVNDAALAGPQMLATLASLQLAALLQHKGIWLAVTPQLAETLNQCCTGQVRPAHGQQSPAPPLPAASPALSPQLPNACDLSGAPVKKERKKDLVR
jgi:hypothetical protein